MDLRGLLAEVEGLPGCSTEEVCEALLGDEDVELVRKRDVIDILLRFQLKCLEQEKVEVERNMAKLWCEAAERDILKMLAITAGV